MQHRKISENVASAADVAAQKRSARTNPFTPLYQAVASAVRSVSRRSARYKAPDGTVHAKENASSEKAMAGTSLDAPLRPRHSNTMVKQHVPPSQPSCVRAIARSRGKENIAAEFPARDEKSTGRSFRAQRIDIKS
jgi:hypothetical protein